MTDFILDVITTPEIGAQSSVVMAIQWSTTASRRFGVQG